MSVKKHMLELFWKQVESSDNRRISGQTFPDGIDEFNDLPYIDDGNPMHLLDVYRMNNLEKNLPVIIDVHGGGWMYGTKAINKNYCMNMASLGFVVFNINYRLVPETTVDGQLRDVSAAIKWIGKNCSKYNGDVNKIFLAGDSAGGHLALLISLLNESADDKNFFALENTDVKINAIGLTSPVVDLLSSNAIMKMNLSELLGNDYKKSPYYAYMDFGRVYNNQTLPPVYLVTSGGDFVRGQSRKLHKILREHNAEHFYHDWSGDECSRSLPHVFSVLNPQWEESKITIYEMVSYFRRFI